MIADVPMGPWPQSGRGPVRLRVIRSHCDDGKIEVDDGFMTTEGAKSMNEILDVASRCCAQLSCRQVASVLRQVAKSFESESQTAASPELLNDQRFAALVKRLSETSGSPDAPRLMMHSIWALGKIGAHGPEVESVVSSLKSLGLEACKDSTARDISNALWGIAKLASAPGMDAEAHKDALALAHLLVSENSRWVQSLSAHCLSNTLWALAKLSLKGPASTFAGACIAQLQSRPLSSMRPQMLANSLWAVARLSLNRAVATPFCTDFACRALASPGALGALSAHELSMVIWAVAKIVPSPVGRAGVSGETAVPPHDGVIALAHAVGIEACCRIRDFNPQSLSNIAWAFAAMNLAQRSASKMFLVSAAKVAGPELHSFSPQAISNLCWAFSKLGNSSVVASFSTQVAFQACLPARQHEFTWHHKATIIDAMARLKLRNTPEVQQFAVWLAESILGHCSELGTKTLLIVSLALARLGVTAELMQAVVGEITQVLEAQAAHLNDIDARQWREVQCFRN